MAAGENAALKLSWSLECSLPHTLHVVSSVSAWNNHICANEIVRQFGGTILTYCVTDTTSLFVVQEVKLKNAGSWSSLASLAVSQAPGSSSAKKSTTAMSFELFKKAAKEKEERVGLANQNMIFLCSSIFT